jgi:hypothetical protein
MTNHVPHLPPHLDLPPHLEGHSSWLSKAMSARILGHPLVWSGVTALFIMAGYLWLQYYARPLSDRIGQSHLDNELIGSKNGDSWSPDIYRPTATVEQMSITRQADILRAENYRETIDLENKIQPLLRQAREYLENETYINENQDNAWQSYQRILDIEPEHRVAKSGQAQILGLLQSNAEFVTEKLHYEEAEFWLGQLDIIQINAPFQVELRQRIADQISAEVAILEVESRHAEKIQFLKNALKDANEAMQVSPPKLRAAYDLYQWALELDVDNQAALDGLQTIHLKRAGYAKQAISKEDFTEAQAQIERLQSTGADSELVKIMESTLEKARAETKMEARKSEESKVSQPIPEPAKDPEPIPEPESTSKPEPQAAKQQTPVPPDIKTIEVEVQKAPSNPSSVDTSSIPVSKASAPLKLEQLTSGIKAYYAGDYNTAFAKLHPLAEANSPRAQFRLGIMYYQGRTDVKNEALARQWIARALPAILRAAQQGQAWAEADLGTAYELGVGVQKDLASAASWYQKSAKQGYVGGQTNLGVLYGAGTGVKYDRRVALYWLKKAAAQGDKIAQNNLKILNAR